MNAEELDDVERLLMSFIVGGTLVLDAIHDLESQLSPTLSITQQQQQAARIVPHPGINPVATGSQAPNVYLVGR